MERLRKTPGLHSVPNTGAWSHLGDAPSDSGRWGVHSRESKSTSHVDSGEPCKEDKTPDGSSATASTSVSASMDYSSSGSNTGSNFSTDADSSSNLTSPTKTRKKRKHSTFSPSAEVDAWVNWMSLSLKPLPKHLWREFCDESYAMVSRYVKLADAQCSQEHQHTQQDD